ncbi:flagellar motor switch protein FliG [Mesorhizobium sp. M1C.F.Ca.ET.193.01.1.1]|uniref:flagellar motor switch protein FliG n=1 Tax=unclassified Mesorhizobium TaxID=325217 RepID=UPI000FD49571|nr:MULTISPECIES: flagellar motor switch protein FliG [unclassified Mesorhizobium]TGS98846.1 flagellar motor switch protein FliG [bacterium M00.F.Ca.ET.177.01.1.1]TGQ52871.1 flagellar motor switch protein FliG [Mesorhizobium sp. M1C.F.Ca.ET.210.01.1.1]TGQ70157.1 flagellar motor switch protein FliG [Mesorhizobium sp. M1C.F.Ca.ET.212.01.1.1]TGR05955.1 flagellar motor switch protein FliG [Mesorhizobium sp. M1C.F.Ca.ET.204.01.1.1]TGR26694.1 flagellar motor switch protein FliG [Mesorhizobium sp. M1C
MTSLTLTRPQKAAAILVAMGKPSASRLLKFFKQEELKALIEGARLLRTIPQGDLERIVAEFEAEFTEGAGLLDSADRMDTILNESLSPEEMSAIMGDRKFEAAPEGPPPIWPDLEKLEPTRLGTFLAGEHPQTSAMVLSKLAPQTAANVLLTMEKPIRSQIIRRMVTMANIPDTATRIVENQLRASVLSQKTTRDTSAGQERVAGVLNEMAKPELDELMQDLEEAGTPDLAGVRSRLFAFDDLPLLAQKARVLLFDGLSTELVTLALRGAPAELTEAALSAIGARSRRMIESELGQGSEGIALADIMAARKTIAVATIRLSRQGAFELPAMQAPAEAA